jgi:hypothetical protein
MALGTAGLPARAAPCEPGFRAIHDFQVGDVFQFRDQGGAQFAAGNMLWEEFRKYRIVSKEGTPQERTYRILGLSRRSAAYPNGLKDTTYSPIDDSLRLVDSAGHSLNGCAGDTVPMPSPGYGFTRIEAAQGDTGWFALAGATLRMKRLGYQEVRRPEDPIFDGPRPTRIYAEGLGLVRESIGYLSSPARFHILIGYVRDGRTVGVVFPDEQLLPVTPIRIQPAAGPAPRAGIAAGRPGSPFDLRGRRLAIPQARARAEGRPAPGPAGGNL